MPTEAIIKNYIAADGSVGSNIWITHEDQRYYSRINYAMDDNPGMRNYCIQQFHARSKIYGR